MNGYTGRMSPSLRALLDHPIDYAGLFPPAQLGMAASVNEFLQVRDSPDAWILNRFVCSVSRLGELAKELGGTAVQGNVTETKDLERVVKAALDKHGRIDGVVNNTGHGPRVMRDSMRFSFSPDSTAELSEIGDDEWHDGVDMYILNVVRMARLVTPVMLKQGKGAIVNISSMAAFQPRAAYPLSVLRTTTQGFVKLYADKYGRHGIRMNNL